MMAFSLQGRRQYCRLIKQSGSGQMGNWWAGVQQPCTYPRTRCITEAEYLKASDAMKPKTDLQFSGWMRISTGCSPLLLHIIYLSHIPKRKSKKRFATQY